METRSPDRFKGWYSRGYLPHLDAGHTIQSVTFRLADSLPQEKLRRLEESLASMHQTDAGRERRKSIETWLDSGYGSCMLRFPSIARMVQETLLRFDGERYRLIAWCIMPNHVHALVEPMIPLSSIVQSWKSYTACEGKRIASEQGIISPANGFWMREFWDRFIRDEEHFRQVVDYIHENPVKAGLCTTPDTWPWSSARKPW
jgi:putative transposase